LKAIIRVLGVGYAVVAVANFLTFAMYAVYGPQLRRFPSGEAVLYVIALAALGASGACSTAIAYALRRLKGWGRRLLIWFNSVVLGGFALAFIAGLLDGGTYAPTARAAAFGLTVVALLAGPIGL